jgi:very-short-patch-repair endonuclease
MSLQAAQTSGKARARRGFLKAVVRRYRRGSKQQIALIRGHQVKAMFRALRQQGAPPDAEALQRIAAERREHPTRAERALAAILAELNEGALDGRFRREWVCSDHWILDFYFPEVRLGIEVDGGYHRSTVQRGRDLLKASELESAGITLLRLTNEEVLGDRTRLLDKLRHAWRKARRNSRANAAGCT